MLCLCIHGAVFAQTGNDADDIPASQISYAVLPDNTYTLQQILAGNHLPFIANDSLRPNSANASWIRIIIANPAHTQGRYNLLVQYNMRSTLYYFDANAQQWMADSAGLQVAKKNWAQSGPMSFILRGADSNILYIKMDESALKKTGWAIKPQFKFQPWANGYQERLFLWNGWIAALAVVLFFFLYNVYMYFSLRDVLILFYLIVQFGIMIYITSYRGYFSIFLPLKIFSARFVQGGKTGYYYDVNNLLSHASIVIIMWGYVQLTRFFLDTRQNFRRLDFVLRFGLYFYITASIILMLVNTLFTFVDGHTLLYDNIYLFLLISVIIYTCVLGYKRKLRAAGPFLLANLLPLVLMVGITVFHVLVTVTRDSNIWLPNLAIVSQALCFSVILVFRTRLIQKELRASEMEAQKLGLELKQIALQHSLVELENQKINLGIQHEKTKNELLQQTLEANQRELASTTLYMVQKNELLARLKTQVAELKKLSKGTNQPGLSGIESLLQANLYLDDDWARFKLHFEQVHPGFFENLQAKHPTLTKNEIRLLAYFHINLSPKEIASLLNVEPDSVRRAKSRLYKKMGYNEPPAEIDPFAGENHDG